MKSRECKPQLLGYSATGGYGELNSEIEFSEDDGDPPEVEATGGPRRKPVPSKLVIKAARARRARRNKTAAGDNIQNIGGSGKSRQSLGGSFCKN